LLVERAIIALGKKKDKRATQVLINLAQKDVGPILKKRCVLSLGEIGDPEAIPLLRKFLKGDNRMLRDYSARVLEKITGKRIEIPEQTTFPAKQKFPQKLLSGPMVKTE
jgi:HEAT repeat protein